jgi:hypothetical protein
MAFREISIIEIQVFAKIHKFPYSANSVANNTGLTSTGYLSCIQTGKTCGFKTW